MTDYQIETSMAYGALVGASANLIVVSSMGEAAGSLVLALFAMAALVFDKLNDD